MVNLDVVRPAQYSRSQLVIRVAIWILLGWFGITLGWMSCALFVALPLIAAGAVHSSKSYLEELAPELWRVLAFLLRCEAYLLCTVDTLASAGDVQIELEVHGQPTVRSALLRLITAIPAGVVVLLASALASVLGVIAFVTILLVRQVPGWVLAFQRATLRMQARFLAYHASLDDEYPSLAFDTAVHPPAARA